MERKPTVAAEYSPNAAELVRRTTLYIATKLGDLRDEVVIIGGLVPSLLLAQAQLPAGKTPHIGTMDVDLGLAIGILNQQKYHELYRRLRNAGFKPDVNDTGETVSQRWCIDADMQRVTVDFLIPPTLDSDKGGKLRNLESGFAAIITPGLELAFIDKRLVTLDGETLHHEQASRDVWVCEAGAFIVLKALAFRGRGENKDAYDLVYILQNYGNNSDDVYRRLQPLLANGFAQQALDILENDFAQIDRVGTMRVAEFLGDAHADEIRADAAGAVRSILNLCRKHA